MKCAILTILTATAAAFAPSVVTKSSSALHMAFEDQLGAQKPLGFWDPVGFLKDADQERFDRLRYVELKHGRVAMLAFLGQITTRSGSHLPGNIDYAGTPFASIPEGLAGLQAIPAEGLTQMLLFVGFLEFFVMKDVTGKPEFDGDFRNNSLDFGWDIYFDDEQKLQKRAIELSNGRAAMMAILGLMAHEQIGGTFPLIGAM
uniref:Plastid light harvesting protein n=1 Tax=Proboscia inermis TaxID=420281 RepID=A0A6T8FT77_9STRA|mmetsp:Transcript_37199/g.43276  ORF Transcript_37199/g.43276 Transcript_37199/m.43276 type:complete len:202 (+) Transcript_37199:62-667(+)|eukprot:CAMPEP_0171293916 /NCGR_PEP_ID=MMETSP0816-20121228/2282_1 /TAXON_ID=420281 /ORGANISM="Proboscia inermis, Strain CCAP1064/1" /LENGTH=201 /DNA_ID=CAMNT_0011765241 /DNA_START=50 /DNA_END=655 /DNA_ORIENTATION=+